MSHGVDRLKIYDGTSQSDLLVVQADPIAGVAADLGSQAYYNDGVFGKLFYKYGPGNTQWIDMTQAQNIVTQAAHGFANGEPVYAGATWLAADAAAGATVAHGIAVVIDVNTFINVQKGRIELTTAEWDAQTGGAGGLTAGTVYYLANGGGLTTVQPVNPDYAQAMVVGLSATEGMVITNTAVVLGTTTVDAMTKIAETIAVGGENTLQIAGINSSLYTDIEIRWYLQNTNNIGNEAWGIRFNGDGTGNYGTSWNGVSGGAANPGWAQSATSIYAGTVYATVNCVAMGHYRGGDFTPGALSEFHFNGAYMQRDVSQPPGINARYNASGMWNNAGPITQIDIVQLTTGTQTLAAGSRIEFWGRQPVVI